jgi:hypothetical protein
MKKIIALILALVLCLGLCACDISIPPSKVPEHTHNHEWDDATCMAPKTCKICGITEGEALEHNYIDGNCTYCQRVGGEIKITLENWDNYFEVYEWVDWNLNAFGEPTEFFGIRCSFNIKSEYAEKCTAEIACEYRINQSHCDITYLALFRWWSILHMSSSYSTPST